MQHNVVNPPTHPPAYTMKIDHLTIRHKLEYAYINVVVSLDEIKDRISYSTWKAESEDYRPVRVMNSIEAYEQYYESLSIEFEKTPNENGWYAAKIDSASTFKPELKYTTQEPLLQFLPKFNKFVYREIVEKNEITLGAMKFLCNIEKLKSSELGPNLLLKTLKTLDMFWY